MILLLSPPKPPPPATSTTTESPSHSSCCPSLSPPHKSRLQLPVDQNNKAPLTISFSISSFFLLFFEFWNLGSRSKFMYFGLQMGLVYGGNNTLYESTGLYGESSVRRVTLQNGKVEALQKLASSYFGEGLTLIGDRLYQLTWADKSGFIYDKYNLSKIGNFNNQMDDGWGLTTDGKILFGSDGSSTFYHIDPQTMKVIQRQNVRYKDHEVHYLNELEYVKGEVWANVMPTDCIVRISPKDGTVLGWILLPVLREGLLAADEIGAQDILNGIAWDNDEERIFVTGKNWPKLFEIKVHQLNHQSHVDIQQLCIQMQPFQKDME